MPRTPPAVPPMASTSQQLDQELLRGRVLGIAREVLEELGNLHAVGTLRCESHLEHDLGLGSLERVELLVRLGSAFHLRLADSVVAQANYRRGCSCAIAEALSSEVSAGGDVSAVFGALAEVHGAGALQRRAEPGCPAEGVPWAETLLDVFRHRACSDADRPHLFLYDGDTPLDPVSFAELYSAGLRVAQALTASGIVPSDTVSLMLPTSREFFSVSPACCCGRGSRSNLSTVSRGSHRGIRDAPISDPAKRRGTAAITF